MGVLKEIFREAEGLRQERDEARADLEEAREEYKLLRDAAARLLAACDALGEQDCTTELMTQESEAREDLRRLLGGGSP